MRSMARAAVVKLLGAIAFTAAMAGCVPPAGSDRSAAIPPVVLVSFDGFRWDYAARTETPTLNRLAAAGVRAERLIPVFPSKTYPGHYSIVTGLYPGHHGIISNNMRDPAWAEPFHLSSRAEVENRRWWGGEPIWVTAKRHGLKAGSYFWPGSEAPVQGVRPDWWFPYDAAVPWDVRVDTVLDWLSRAAAERASLATLYFEEPNDAGHAHGPDAPETLEAVRRADRILGRLLDGLTAHGVAANVIVVSDHGMTATDPSRLIVLDDYVSLLPGELFEFGAVGQIFPQPGRDETIFAALDGAHAEMAVYRKGTTPGHLHLFDHPRVAPIVLIPSPGWEVVPRTASGTPPISAGDHGFDPASPDMHGIFYAAGPGIAQAGVIGAVEQVDIYALICRLLRIEPASNDGVWDRISGAVAAR